ncbi:hypothetical protein ACHAWF_015367 [Thalassiosira exigua]
MHLNECLELAFSRPTPAGTLGEAVGPDGSNPHRGQVPGSVLSTVRCVARDWGTKSRTNFHIPPERLAGYSYLFEDGTADGAAVTGRHRGWGGNDSGDDRPHAQRHPCHAFVRAEEPSNLHSHHYDFYSENMSKIAWTSAHFAQNRTGFASGSYDQPNPPHHMDFTTQPLPSSSIIARGSAHPELMTVPYIHPELGTPVPPLQLPWHFGLLCWSFAWGGFVMLRLGPPWAKGRRAEGEDEPKRKRWFPFRAFAWACILLQSPCSFLADYVHMTNVSTWHTVDRILACFMLSLEMIKVATMRPYTRPAVYAFYVAAVAGALFCFLRSQGAQEALNAEGFVFWHNGWHCYPLNASIVAFAEVYLDRRWGIYCGLNAKGEAGERVERRGALGSDEKREGGENSEGSYPPDVAGGRTPGRPTRARADVGSATPRSYATHDIDSPGVRRSRRIAGKKPEVRNAL